MYQPRVYRRICQPEDLISFLVEIKETDLFILAEKNLSTQAKKAAQNCRGIIEKYIKQKPSFLTNLAPIPHDPFAPPIIASMIWAAQKTNVGPMAAVAGAVAEFVGRELLKHCSQVIIENGGDIFLKSSKKRIIRIQAGKSSFNNKIALQIEAEQSPLGICTSSGTVGHSLSFGRADAVVVLSSYTALADAAATAIGNIIQTKDDINPALEKTKTIEGITGVVLIKDDQAGFWGKVKIIETS